jgi:argininosuccinate lyase
MKDDLAITLKKIEEFFIELNQEGIIKKEHLQEILQKLRELKETVNELQDIFDKIKRI